MKAKEIVLLILIITIGVFFYHAQTGKIHLDFDWGEDIFFTYDEFIYEESQVLEEPFPSEIQIINAHGSVEIQGTEENKIRISLQKKIWRKTEEQAREVSDELKISVNKYSDRWIVSTNREEFRRKKFRTIFTISLPSNMDVWVKNSYGLVKVSKVGNTEINNNHGQIIASDINGDLNLQNSYKDIEVENVQSDCRIESKHSHVYLQHIGGMAIITHKYGKVHLENISRDVNVESRYTEVYGQELAEHVEIESSYKKITLLNVGPTKINGHHSSIEVEGTDGFLNIYNKYGSIDLSNIQGDLSIDGKNLSVYGKSITGEKISISSSYRTIELSEFSGKTSIFHSHGKIILEPSPLTHPIEVKGKYSDITLLWPFEGVYPFEAQAKSGAIKWGLPDELSLHEENHLSTIKAFQEEKENPSIFLYTTYGTIKIEE